MVDKNSQWKDKVQSALNNVQEELRKTTDIGVRMFNASKTTGCLRESYEELGKLVAREMKGGRLEFSHQRAKELLEQIKECENSLNSIEEEVNDIRFTDKK